MFEGITIEDLPMWAKYYGGKEIIVMEWNEPGKIIGDLKLQVDDTNNRISYAGNKIIDNEREIQRQSYTWIKNYISSQKECRWQHGFFEVPERIDKSTIKKLGWKKAEQQ